MHRSRSRRILGTVLAVLTATATLAVSTQEASAAATCSGSSCAVLSALDASTFANQGTTITLNYTLTISGGQARASLHASQSAGLAAVPGSVRVDGTAIPSAAVTVSGTSLAADLSAVNPIPVGQHSLSYAVTMSHTANSDQTSQASLSFDDTLGGPTVTARAATASVRLGRPDYQINSLTAPFSPLTANGTANLALAEFGSGNVPARLDLNVPTGFSLGPISDSETQRRLTCSNASAHLTRCLGNFGGIHSFNIEVHAAGTDPVGLTGTLVATLVPLGITDATPANNTRSVTLRVSGSAAVVAKIVPATGSIAINTPNRYTITVTNLGPNAAHHVHANVLLETNDLKYFSVSFPNQPNLTGHPQPGSFPYRSWTIGTLAKGQSTSISVVVTGSRLNATAHLALGIIATDELNPQQCQDRACNDAAGVNLTVVATPPAGASDSSTGGLPATGAPVRAPLGWGVLALLLGALLLGWGRRRTA